MLGDLSRLRKCFQPRQWFMGEDESDPSIISDEDTFMWVYRRNAEGKFEVGYYTPDKTWNPTGAYDDEDSAAARVNFLNGGKRETQMGG